MSFDPGALEAALTAAVGDDPVLVADLRNAFLDSAGRQVDALGRARCDANWRMSAWRLHGLAASFGAVELMTLAEDAADGAPGDPVVLRRIRATMELYAI
jgi:hypothetical protein